MIILSCTASRADASGLREPYGWSVPSGERIRILLDTGKPDPSYIVREYGGVHTWSVEPSEETDPLLALAMDSTIVRHLFSRVPQHNIGGEVCYEFPDDLS